MFVRFCNQIVRYVSVMHLCLGVLVTDVIASRMWNSVYVLAFICLGCSIVFVQGQRAWTDCVPDEFSDPIYVHSFVIEPLPIVLPGTFNVSFDAVIDRDVDELVIDVEVGLRNATTGHMEKVYPLDRDYWRIFTACLMIDKTLFRNISETQYDLDIQINKMMLEALSYMPGCPLLQGRIHFYQRPLVLPLDTIEINALRLGQYAVKITYKSSANMYLGCLQVGLNYGGQILH